MSDMDRFPGRTMRFLISPGGADINRYYLGEKVKKVPREREKML
jgi:hypothetical protein